MNTRQNVLITSKARIIVELDEDGNEIMIPVRRYWPPTYNRSASFTQMRNDRFHQIRYYDA